MPHVHPIILLTVTTLVEILAPYKCQFSVF